VSIATYKLLVFHIFFRDSLRQNTYFLVAGTFEYRSAGKLADGADVVFLMRKHRMTIELLASKLGTTQKRVRKLRKIGIADPPTVRDWIQAITDTDRLPHPWYSLLSSLETWDSCTD
jgi:hypothetical protein